MLIAAIVIAVAGVLLAVGPLFVETPLGLGPFVSVAGGSVSVIGLLLGLLAFGTQPRIRSRRRSVRMLVALTLLATFGFAAGLLTRQILTVREADAVRRRTVPDSGERAAAQRAADRRFETELQDNLDK